MKSVLKVMRIGRGLQRRLRTQMLLWQGTQIGKGTFIGQVKMTRPDLVRIGANCMIEDDVAFDVGVSEDVDFQAPTISVGSGVHIGTKTIILCQGNISIGDDVMIAPGCMLVDHNHGFRTRDVPMSRQSGEIAPLKVENDVWIGGGSTLLKGITISEGAIIGAGSVVTKNVGPFEIWGGVPARHISMRPS